MSGPEDALCAVTGCYQRHSWSAALDNLIERESRYRGYEGIRDDTYKWEREAIFRLRALLIVCGAVVEDAE